MCFAYCLCIYTSVFYSTTSKTLCRYWDFAWNLEFAVLCLTSAVLSCLEHYPNFHADCQLNQKIFSLLTVTNREFSLFEGDFRANSKKIATNSV